MAALVALLVVALPPASSGQTVHSLGITAPLYNGVFSSGQISSPSDVILDSQLNLYLTDQNKNDVEMFKKTGNTYSQTPTVLATGFSSPQALAMDAANNIYVADTGNNVVKKIPYTSSGYGTPITIGTGFNTPRGVAVDAVLNVYVSDYGNNAVKKISLGSSGYGTPTTVAGVSSPRGVAVDAAYNVYVTDPQSSAVDKVAYSNGTYGQPVKIATGFSLPTGLSIDSTSNLYVCDSTFKNLVYKIPFNGSTYGTQLTVGNGYGNPGGVATDTAGNVYVADPYSESVLEVTQTVDFGAQPVYASGKAPVKTVAFGIDSAGTLGKPLFPLQVLAQSDFSDAGTGTCTTNGTSHSYAAGDTCTVDVAYGASIVGGANGAVEIPSNSGAVLATTYVKGIGSGALAAYPSGTPATTLVNGFKSPYSVALDAAGNVYVADYGNNAVEMFPYNSLSVLSSITASQGTVLGSGFKNPSAVALDGAGNVYVVDSGNNAVKKIPYVKGQFGTPITLATGFKLAYGLAVDGAGNVYVSDSVSNNITKIPYLAGSYGTPVVVALGFNGASGLAVDSAQNLYVADFFSNAIKEVPYSAFGTYGPPFTAVSGLSAPVGVSLDAAGDIYVADSGSGTIKFSQLNGLYAAPVTFAGGFKTPQSVVLAGASLYLVDLTNNVLQSLQLSSPGTLPAFANTAVGSTSPSQSITILNLGNAALTFPIPTSGTNPSATTNFSVSNSTTCPQLTSSASAPGRISPGFSCAETVAFTPTAGGTLKGTLGFTVVSVTGLNSNQTVNLTGTALPVSPTVTVIPATITAGATPTTLSATVAYIGASAPSGAVTFQVDSGATVAGTCTGSSSPQSCTASYATAALSLGAHTITVSVAADATYTATSNTASLTVNAPPDFTFTTPAVSSQTIASGQNASYSFQLAPQGSVYPGPVSFSVAGLPTGATYTLTPTSVAQNAGAQTVALAIQTPLTALQRESPAPWSKSLPIAFAFALLPVYLRRSRLRLRSGIAALLLFAGSLAAFGGLTGCSSGQQQRAPVTYNVTLTATSGSAVHTGTVVLIVR